MKSIIRIFILPLVLLTACVDSLDDYNIDAKRAPSVTAETLYTAALKSFMDIITTPNVNSNNYRLYVQHWTTTQYLDEPRYVLTARLIPQNFWDAIYRDVLADLTEARRIINADALINPNVKNNQLAQIGILEVYAWAALVNTYGNVPYTEALDPETPLPKFDDARTIYLDLLTRLDASLALLNTQGPGFGTGELLYSSKPAAQRIPSWVKLGNSIKLKLAMIVVEDPASASVASAAIQAAAPLVFTSNADNARFPYINDPPNNNPVSANLNALFTSRRDFVGSRTIVELMKGLNDPRLPFFFNTVPGTANFVGGYYGYTNNPVANYSEISDKVKAANFEALLMDYAEVSFLLAEAVERGIVAGDAEAHYNNAVKASIIYWGGTEDDANDYLGQEGVSYGTAGATWQEKIGVQKWLALYNRGWDAWVEWRRLDYPQLLSPSEAEPAPGQDAPASALFIPLRMIYPINEQTLNPANRAAAATAIGGDNATTPLFWDVD
jgi:hypothetical protein